MVTKQEQLEFAAKHIEKWKSGYDYAVVERDADGYLYVRWPSVCTSGITKKEWRQEREKMGSKPEVDGSWHERGELPPVGTICEMIDDIATWRECKIIAHEDGACIGWIASLNAPFYTYDKSELRPLRTEREKAIDEMADLIAKSVFGSAKCQAEKLYEAGYRKVKP